MRGSPLCRLLAAALAVVLFLPAPAWSAPPTLTRLVPAGGQRGTRVRVTCTGTFAWPVKVWAPGLKVTAAKEKGKLDVVIPADLAADRVWVRLYDAEGASAAAPFLIDNLAEVAEREPNDHPRTAQALAKPEAIVNGVLAKAGDVDCFAVQLPAGRTLVAKVDANMRLGTPMDAIVQVTTPEGNVIAENNDDVHLDPLVSFTPAKAGRYVVRVFAFPSTPGSSIRLSGGPEYVYRLTLTNGPFVTHAVPLAAPPGRTGTVAARGWNLPAGAALPVAPYGGAAHAEYQECETPGALRPPPGARLGFAFDARFAGSTRLRLCDLPIVAAPADPAAPMALPLAASVTGSLRKPRQADAYRLMLRKGQPIVITVEAGSLGSTCDPEVRLMAPGGATVARAVDVGPDREATLTHAAAKDGEYRLTVADRYRRGGERGYYRLTVRPEAPDFELTVGADAVVAAPGKPAELSVKVRRFGKAVGAIAIEATGLPPGVTAAPVTSAPSGPTAAAVTLKLTATGPAFSGPIRVTGRAKGLQRRAHTAPRLGAAFDAIWLTVVGRK